MYGTSSSPDQDRFCWQLRSVCPDGFDPHGTSMMMLHIGRSVHVANSRPTNLSIYFILGAGYKLYVQHSSSTFSILYLGGPSEAH